MENLFNKICEYAESIFTCRSELHGPAHWRRVDINAQLLTEHSGADIIVVRLFAYLHDSCRLDDGRDHMHGPRAANNLPDLPESFITISSTQMQLLEYAIRHHTDGITSDDPTIGTCWDADRLDLGRVGITPIAERMSTQAGKDLCFQ
ncbi:MAG: hypothetical protein KAI74_02070 [Kiritimatiellae bacterium]|nr:hypothetical protein [Kiritimatiellia bacterium]